MSQFQLAQLNVLGAVTRQGQSDISIIKLFSNIKCLFNRRAIVAGSCLKRKVYTRERSICHGLVIITGKKIATF